MNSIVELNTTTLEVDPEIEQIQQKLKQVLFAIDDVCRKHNLTYYLIAGTMLGSVRHKGFVPWDDDGDIGMPRADYEKFVAHANEWLPKQFELVCGTTNPQYPYLFARVQDKETTYILWRRFKLLGGVPIDVFPLDGMTSNKLCQRIHYFTYSFFKRWLYFATVDPYKHGKGIYSCFITSLQKVLSPAKLHHILDNIQKEYEYEKSPLVADHDNKPARGILPKEVYGIPVPTEFEGHQLMGVAEPDTYLTCCYNDYMTIPPVEKRPRKNYRYLDVNKPYREYTGDL